MAGSQIDCLLYLCYPNLGDYINFCYQHGGKLVEDFLIL